MSITLIGFGSGKKEYLTEAACEALDHSDLIIGAARLIDDALDCGFDAEMISETKAESILELIEKNTDRDIAVIYSGDTGLYSGATGLIKLLRERDIAFRNIPGISSIQLFSAATGIPWQDMRIVSANGRQIDVASLVEEDGNLFILTDNVTTPKRICEELTDAGYGDRQVIIGEDLGTDKEHITEGTAEELSGRVYSSLSVVFISYQNRYITRS